MRPKIVFENVTKSFNLYKKQSEKLLEIISYKKEKDSFLAVNDLSFVINEGETVGIVGLNGSGKSTLSNLIAGIIPPTSGSIEINGQTSLIAISAGLNNQLSGRENIELKCLMHGMDNKQIKEVTPKIIEFADIGKFIEQPVKNYSSGMKSRLGFAISIHTNPDVLIVDEALSVGDQTFYQKCIDKMNQYKSEGKTIIFISHSISQVESFCDRVIWMSYGKMTKFGETKAVLGEYKEFIKWFNALNESEKLAYKNEMLEAQYQENSLQISKRKRRKDKQGKSLFVFQFILLLLVSVMSGLLMFGVQPVQSIENYFFNTQIADGDIFEETNEDSNNLTEEVNKQGMVVSEQATLYQEPELQTKGMELKFADELFVEELIEDVYKVRVNNKISYVRSKSIEVLNQPIQELALDFNNFLPLFPATFSNSYLYFFAFFDTDSDNIKSKLRNLTAEERLEDGTSILRYSDYDIQYSINQDGIAESLSISNINLQDDIWDEIKSEAIIISNDEDLYFFNTAEYKIIMNVDAGELIFISKN